LVFSENEPNTYNILNYWFLFGFNHSEETKAKKALAKTGENNPMLGETWKNNPIFDKTWENNPIFGKTKTLISLAMSERII